MDNYRFTYVDAEGTTTIKSSAGVLKSIVLTSPAATAIEVYDGVDGTSATKIAEIQASADEQTFHFGCTFAKGLYIRSGVPGIANKLTVVWR